MVAITSLGTQTQHLADDSSGVRGQQRPERISRTFWLFQGPEMTPFWLIQAPEIRKSLFGVFRGLKLTFLGFFRCLKWHLLGFFRPLKSWEALLEFSWTLNDYMLAFSGAWKDTLLAEKGDILILYWYDIQTKKTLPTPNHLYRTLNIKQAIWLLMYLWWLS